jgi:ATP-dependent protease Clp ATPase subunit
MTDIMFDLPELEARKCVIEEDVIDGCGSPLLVFEKAADKAEEQPETAVGG